MSEVTQGADMADEKCQLYFSPKAKCVFKD